MTENYLEIPEINPLLPEELRIGDKIERSLYLTAGGDPISVSVSKLYENNNTFWYSIVAGYFIKKGVKVFCLVAGKQGVFLIPKDTLKEYCRKSGWKQHNKGRSYYVRIKHRDDRFYLFSSEQADIDITDTFIRCAE